MKRCGHLSGAGVPHVWHQGRKVTHFADRGAHRGYCGYWADPQEQHAEVKSRRAAYFRRQGPRTIGDRAKLTGDVAHATGWFRLVDAHGKPYGRRYQRIAMGPTLAMVRDQYGVEHDMNRTARVRLVDQQPEDYHSYASRVLARAHKQEE